MNAKEASRIWESVFFSLPTGSFFHSHSRFCVTLFFFIEDFESHHGHCVANLSQLFADGGSRGSYFRWPPTRELGFLAETFTDQTLNWCDPGRETLFHFKSWETFGRPSEQTAKWMSRNQSCYRLSFLKQCVTGFAFSMWPESNGLHVFLRLTILLDSVISYDRIIFWYSLTHSWWYLLLWN